MSSLSLQALQEQAQQLMDATTSKPDTLPGCIVTFVDRKGNTLFHGASGVREADTQDPLLPTDFCWIASCTKLVTVVAALQLVERGLVTLDEPLGKHLPELEKLEILESIEGNNFKTRSSGQAPTLRQLLTHTAGQSYEFFNRNTKKWADANGVVSFDCSRASISAPLAHAPGTAWEYGSSIDWAGQLVERLSGKTLNEYFKENIWTPIGAKNVSFLPKSDGLLDRLSKLHLKGTDGKIRPIPHHLKAVHDESKVEVQYGGAGLIANSADYCKLLSTLANNGESAETGARILQKSSVDELFKGQLDEKLIKDLDRDIPDADPEQTYPIQLLPGVRKQWSAGGLMTLDGLPNGRSADSFWWAGIANLFYFVDRGTGLSGMIQTQLHPFNNMDVLGLFFFQLEPIFQAAVKGA